MLLLTLMAFGAIVLTSSMWLFGKLTQEDKILFVDLYDDHKV